MMKPNCRNFCRYPLHSNFTHHSATHAALGQLFYMSVESMEALVQYVASINRDLRLKVEDANQRSESI